MKPVLELALLMLLPAMAQAGSPATGRDLAATCEFALAHDFKGMEAAMCEWYVQPCGVCGVNKPPATHCIPEHIPVRELAAHVAADLRARDELLASPVKDAVDRVLATRYPCRR